MKQNKQILFLPSIYKNIYAPINFFPPKRFQCETSQIKGNCTNPFDETPEKIRLFDYSHHF